MKKALILNIYLLILITMVLIPEKGYTFEKRSPLPPEITQYYAEVNFVAAFSTPRSTMLRVSHR